MRIEDINFFYINCKSDIDKNQFIMSQWNDCCKEYGSKINLIRRDAVHYTDYSYPFFTESYQPEDSKIKNQTSNFAVFKSHSNLWKYIWDNDLKYSFILEDDAIIPKTFLNDLERILNNNDFINNVNNWDSLYFGILRMYCKNYNKDFNIMLNKKGYNNGLHAYMIHKKTAGKLLSLLAETGASNQIDILLRDYAHIFKFFVYKDLLIKQEVENFQSTRLGRFVKEEFKNTFDEINIVNESEQKLRVTQ